MKKMSTSIAAIATAAILSPAAFAATSNVLPEPLPSDVRSVSPPQGWVSLDSQSGYQLGISAIDVSFNADYVTATGNPELFIEIFKDGSETPAERLCATEAFVAETERGQSPGFKFKRSFTTKGVYNIVIPAGVWKLDNTTLSQEIKLNYELTNDMLLYPTPGVVDEITDIEVIFPSAFESKLVGGSSKLQFFKVGSDTSINPQIRQIEPEIEGEEQNRWNLHFATPVTEPGEYVLRIEEGEWSNTWYGEDFSKDPSETRTVKSDFIMVRYYVPELKIPTVDPANNSELTSLGLIKITVPEFDEASFILVNSMAANYVYPVFEDGTIDTAPLARYSYYQPEGFQPKVVNGEAMMFDEEGSFYLAPSTNPEEAIVPAPGKYVLKLGTRLYYGGFAKGMLSSSPYEFYYNVIADPTVMEFVQPSGTYDLLSEITVRFPNAETATPDESDTAPELYLKDEAGNNVSKITATSNGGIMILAEDEEEDEYEGASIDFTLEEPVTKAGIYTLDVPEGYITLNGKYSSNPISFRYVVTGNGSGIEAVNTTNSNVTVFTTTGICVLKNADPSALESLQKGIYIVNGKKLIIL